eukprot:TRINITY_DN540_c0_g1_i1.p1 TRINITY_DN540_c0_g1~~TRINITY_DN540_c0_g1_i1.p1  ORF type:complete len:566 (-),score=171.68 TRINITY_DN540_c0_g1_i1:15-1691(-)
MAAPPASMAAADNIGTTISMSFACRELVNMDLMSKSDPMIVVSLKDAKDKWQEIGRTEMIKDNLNPVFQRQVTTKFYFEKVQKIRVQVFDVDNESARLADQDFLGETFFALNELFGAKGNKFVLTLKKDQRARGKVLVFGEEVNPSPPLICTFRFAATNLDKKDFFGSSDPFFVMNRTRSDGSIQAVYTSEHIDNNVNPVWQELSISSLILCNNDHKKQIVIEIYDWNKSGKHEIIGAVKTTLGELLGAASTARQFAVINPEKAKKKGYTSSGQFFVNTGTAAVQSSFLDYVANGFELSLVFAIDFTASNGHPANPQSLHFRPQTHPNDYQTAIMGIGNIVGAYDSDKNFPALGFGARLAPGAPASHCFFMNMNPSNPEVNGIQGVLDVYAQSISTFELYGPTNFAPVIRWVSQVAANVQAQKIPRYYVLLIITDGEINDMYETIEAIVYASRLPMSIIIVGVGPAEFTNMKLLDSDDGMLRAGDVYAERDIVQFVPLREMAGKTPEAVAEVTLAELPRQFLDYVRTRQIPPPPRYVAPSGMFGGQEFQSALQQPYRM